MKRIWLLVWLIFCFANVKGDTIFVSSLKENTKLAELKHIEFADAGSTWRNPSLAPTQNYLPYTKEIVLKSRNSYWLRFTLHNNSSEQNTILIRSMFDYTCLYKKTADSLVELGRSGHISPSKELAIKYARYYIPIYLAPAETATFYYWVYERHLDTNDSDFLFVKKDDALLKEYRKEVNKLSYSLFFLGAFSFLSLFMLFMYYKSRQRIYLFYSLYLIGAILYSLTRLSTASTLGAWAGNFPIWRLLFNEPSQLLFFAAYNFFVKELLDTKNQDPLLNKILKYLSVAYLIYAVCYMALNALYFSQEARATYFNFSRWVLLPVNLFLIIRSYYTIKLPIYKYFFAGICCFMLASVFSVFSVVVLRDLGIENIKAINIFQLGLMAEALCFAFALGHKIKLDEEEKNKAQKALIQQLELDQQAVEQANLVLEEKVKQRTAELVLANKKIEERKTKELKIFFDQQLAQAKTMALRSQMNPHFLFNSLNSIKYLIQSQQNKLAVVYLTKFSKLVRMVLEHSRVELVSLSAEIEALRLYLEIESNRLGEQFTYQINIEKGIETDSLQIPPMLLQPFVENSIWHGLLNSSKTQKEVIISISQNLKKGLVFCDITDNGIGREKAAAYKEKSTKTRQSLGTSLIFERIRLFNLQYPNKITVQIDDVVIDNKTAGTKVQICIHEEKNHQNSIDR